MSTPETNGYDVERVAEAIARAIYYESDHVGSVQVEVCRPYATAVIAAWADGFTSVDHIALVIARSVFGESGHVTPLHVMACRPYATAAIEAMS